MAKLFMSPPPKKVKYSEELIFCLSKDNSVNLNTLTVAQLERLLYQEEKYIAENIIKYPPFSRIRENMLSQGYDICSKLRESLDQKKHTKRLSMGANKSSAGLVYNFLVKKRKKSNEEILFFEAGVGTGYTIQCIKGLQFVRIKGCDIHIPQNTYNMTKNNKNIELIETTVLKGLLALKKGSIDLFYADNVFEHLLPDEIDKTLSVLSNRLKNGKKGGSLILIIPNLHIGPSDISGKFQKMGTKATGLHFMECSYSDWLSKMKKHNIVPTHLAFPVLSKKKYIYIRDLFGILNRIKVILEPILGLLNENSRKSCFVRLGYNVYIMKKNK